MNDRSRNVENRLLAGARACGVLLIRQHFVLLGTPWGRQFDDAALLGRETLNRKIITLDSDIFHLIRKRALLLAAMLTLVIAVVRRCTLVGVTAVAAFGCAVAGAEVLKKVLPWRTL